MGGWLSSLSPTPEYVRTTSATYGSSRPSDPRPPSSASYSSRVENRTAYSDYRSSNNEWMHAYAESYEPTPRSTIFIDGGTTRENFLLSDSKMFSHLRYDLLLILDKSESSINVDSPTRRTLSTNSSDFIAVKKKFMNTTRKYNVVKIEELLNPFLKVLYLLRYMEYEILNGCGSEKVSWFHGTKRENVVSICMNNFNWRLHGKARGNIFGKGVSFSPISDYAANYCDKDGTKVMILAESMFIEMCMGNRTMKIPPYCDKESKTRYDTSGKCDGKVCVKYYDDEYYPRFIIHFVNNHINALNA